MEKGEGNKFHPEHPAQTEEQLRNIHAHNLQQFRNTIFTQFAPYLRWGSGQTWIYGKYPATKSPAEPTKNHEIAIITNYVKTYERPAIAIFTNELAGWNTTRQSSLYIAESFLLWPDDSCQYTCDSFEIRNNKLAEETRAKVIGTHENYLLLSNTEQNSTMSEEVSDLMVQYSDPSNLADQYFAATQATKLVKDLVASKTTIQHGTLVSRMQAILE